MNKTLVKLSITLKATRRNRWALLKGALCLSPEIELQDQEFDLSKIKINGKAPFDELAT